MKKKQVWREGYFKEFLKYHPEIEILEVEIECGIGGSIPSHIKTCIDKSKEFNLPISFDANGLRVIVDGTTPEDLWEKGSSICWDYEIKILGPQYPVLDPKFKELMDPIVDTKNRIHELESEVRELKDKLSRMRFLVKTDGIEFEVGDLLKYENWIRNNQSGYGRAAIEYGFNLGKLLQVDLANPKPLAPEVITHEMISDNEKLLAWMGITGFQHGAAVQVLKTCWKYKDLITEDTFKY